MKVIRFPHDKFFRSAMADLRVAKEFVQSYLPPAIANALDLNSLRLMPNSYIDANLKATFADVVYQVHLKHGEIAYICTLLYEHQTKVEPLMPFRVWQYVINSWNDHLKQQREPRFYLPLVIPIVVYSGTAPYTGATDIRELIQAPAALIEEALFHRTFKLIELNQLAEEEFKKHQWAGTMAWIMRHIRDEDILVSLRHILDTLRSLEQAGGTDFVVLLLNYCLTSAKTINIEAFQRMIQQELSPETGVKIMTIAEQLIEQGKREGWLEGKLEGRLEGQAEGERVGIKKVAIKALQQGLSLEAVAQITGLSEEEIHALKQETVH